ncbi:hypothetical protein BD410DRAFT_165295 [Rickenella mellea]|uniref:Uncharacterized protein n=1 Tax=Rickenella mellea TaxID=50990 RepID=A0A4Y7Q8L6_9AGAM|nr:hypothetical protein BD410DRAFT_165295 [Rickenella mellea]
MSSWSTFQPPNISPPPSPEPAYFRKDRVRTVAKGPTTSGTVTQLDALDPWKPTKPTVLSTEANSRAVPRSRLSGEQSISPSSRSQAASGSRFDSFGNSRTPSRSPSYPNPNASSPTSARVPPRRTSTSPWELYTVYTGSPSDIISGSSRGSKSPSFDAPDTTTVFGDPVPVSSASEYHDFKTPSSTAYSDPTNSLSLRHTDHPNSEEACAPVHSVPVQLHVSVPVQKEASGSSSLTWSSKASIPLSRTRTSSRPQPSSISVGADKIIAPIEPCTHDSSHNTLKQPDPCPREATSSTPAPGQDAYPDALSSLQDIPSQDAATTTAQWLTLRNSESGMDLSYQPTIASSSMTMANNYSEGSRMGGGGTSYSEGPRASLPNELVGSRPCDISPNAQFESLVEANTVTHPDDRQPSSSTLSRTVASRRLVETEENTPSLQSTSSRHLNPVHHAIDTIAAPPPNAFHHGDPATLATRTESGPGPDVDDHRGTALEPSSASSQSSSSPFPPSIEALSLSHPPGVFDLTEHADTDVVASHDEERVIDNCASSTTAISRSSDGRDSLALRTCTELALGPCPPTLLVKEKNTAAPSRPPSPKEPERNANSAKDDASTSFCCCVIS